MMVSSITSLISKVYECTFTLTQAVYASFRETVVSIGNNNHTIQSFNHEEADTRIIVHILHALEQVFKRIKVFTINNDVIVFHVGSFVKLTRGQPLENACIAFGIDEDLRFYSINAICATLVDLNFQYSMN